MLHKLTQSRQIIPFVNTELYQSFKPELITLHQPDIHLVKLADKPLARCSLWWQNVPNYEKRLGFIGHYAALTDDAGEELLEKACQELKEQGCELTVGPLDGTTWRNYRFVTEGSAPPFFLEPINPPSYPKQWQRAGFDVLASYFSVLQNDLSPNPYSVGCQEELEQKGIRVRQLDRTRLDAELESIFDLSLKSFSKNFLYSPISSSEFKAQYEQVLSYLIDELVLLAEHRGKLLGFLFALPDLAQKMRGEPVDTFIIKTLATHPDFSGQGIASCLSALSVERGKQLGFQKAIHALMLETNHSRTISKHYAPEPLRRYVLFAKEL
ncbi:MAG: GNAT family N-acetyltransferase [Trueperaceae bacterium]|nr:GNAT family N-acetyltransferase [Trueperaceae bacterium]